MDLNSWSLNATSRSSSRAFETFHFVIVMEMMFLSDEGPMLETLYYTNTIRIGSTPTFLYFDLYLYSTYAAHYV